jgi:hypothetical protein
VNAALRFSRDKRGYEHFCLVQTAQPGQTSQRRGEPRSRLLYWFRTPPNVKVGREPFDEEARRALEARNPRVTFDWKTILATPIPSADAEKWRERRHAERASRAAGKSGPDVVLSSIGEINDLENDPTLERNATLESNETVESSASGRREDSESSSAAAPASGGGAPRAVINEPNETPKDDEGNDPNTH